MAEMTIEQQRALALARARVRAGTTPQAPAQNGSGSVLEPSKPIQRAGVQPQAPLAVLQPAWDALGSGVADAGIKSFLGVRQLFGGSSDADKKVLREIKAEEELEPSPGLRTTGNILGNMALTAVPASKAERVLRGARAVPGVLRAAGAAGGSGAGVTFLTEPGEGETMGEQFADKGKRALFSAALGGTLAGGARALARPFAPTAEAQQLMRQGVNPTLQQGAAGRGGRFVGGLTSGAVNVRDRQEAEVARALLDRVTDGNVRIPNATGREISEAAQDYVNTQGYAPIFRNKRFPIAPRHVAGAQQAAQDLGPRGQFVQESTQAGRTVGNVFGNTGDRVRNVNYDTLMDDFLEPLSRRAYDDAPNDEVRRRILAARQYLVDNVRNTRLSPDEQAALRTVDIKNFDVNRIREAVKGAVGEDEGLTLGRLANAYAGKTMAGNRTAEELIGPARRVLGATPRQDQARTALITAGRIGTGAGLAAGSSMLGVPGVAPIVGGLYGTSLLGQTAGGARALMGETDPQRAIIELLRRGVAAPAATSSASVLED